MPAYPRRHIGVYPDYLYPTEGVTDLLDVLIGGEAKGVPFGCEVEQEVGEFVMQEVLVEVLQLRDRFYEGEA